ncbi:MAG: hypothetical protein HY925_08300 [Elusimicrobia bacterium]|nr:hypothetical protein [Elusimicrobiota bacterium]
MTAGALLALWLALPASAADDAAFEADRYPESTPAAIVKANPCKSGAQGYEVKDVLFSLRAEYRPVTRGLVKEHVAPIRRWTEKLKAADHAPRFTRELRIGRGKDAAWAATTQDVLDSMKKELRPGETVWFFMSFIGCVGEDPAFALDEYEPPDDGLDEEATSVVI